MPRAVLDIDVKDEAFRRFLTLYESFNEQLKTMSASWDEASKAAEGVETATGGMTGSLVSASKQNLLSVSFSTAANDVVHGQPSPGSC